MSPSTISLLAGLVGAAIGASASIITVIVQSKIQDRRERQKQAIDLALEVFRTHIDLAKQTPGSPPVPPISLYIDYHLRLSKLIESGTLTTHTYEQLCTQNWDFHQAILKINKEHREPPQ